MSGILPFGSNPNNTGINVQKFCGASVIDFQCSADFSSQGGSLNVNLVEDDVNNDRFRVPVISQPTGFIISDSSGNYIFSFYGLIDGIFRKTSPNGKTYNVSIASPLKILESNTIITNSYVGYGSGVEGLPRYYSNDGYYQISDTPDNYLPVGCSKTPSVDYYQVAPLSFGTNNANLNFRGMWANQYNLLNVYGVFENDLIGLVNFKGFGASANSEAGMTLDRVCYALDNLVNKTTSSASGRFLGGNLLLGTNHYNLCSTASQYSTPNPYYYGLDIIGFYNQVVNYLTPDYRVNGPLSVLEMVTQVCEEINADFQVELNIIDYTGSGDLTTYVNTLYSVYDFNEFQLSQTYPNSSLGGIISIRVLPRNTFIDCEKPFSNIAYQLIGLERPNFGGYGTETGIHPGTAVGFDSAFYQPSFGDATNPLDHDYSSVGTKASTPYGGKFPVEQGSGNGSLLTEVLNRAVDINVGLKATESVTSKMVVGGFQTRMVPVPRDFIYQYWGDITVIIPETGDCSSVSRSSEKKIPVVTQILPPNDIVDCIFVDIKDLIPTGINFWDSTWWENGWVKTVGQQKAEIAGSISGIEVTPFYKGIYIASLTEIRSAMIDMDTWEDFLEIVKPNKNVALDGFVRKYDIYINQKAQIEKLSLGSTLQLNTNGITLGSQKSKLKEHISHVTEVEYPEEEDSFEETFYEGLYQKLRSIGETHYGKSWYAPIPFFRTKITENNDNLIGDYVRSWDLTDAAYVEPSLFNTINAPFDSKFISDGKLKPFVNYEYAFYPDSTNSLGYDVFTNKLQGFSPSSILKYDFSEFDAESIVFDRTGCAPVALAHSLPNDISSNYEFLPCAYFATYNRHMMPFFDLYTSATSAGLHGKDVVSNVYGKVYWYDSEQISGVMPSSVLNNCGVTSKLVNSIFASPQRLYDLSAAQVWTTGYNGFYIQAPSQRFSGVIDNFLNLRVLDNGTNSFPFVKFTTNRVYYPYATDSGISPKDDAISKYLYLKTIGQSDAQIDSILKGDLNDKIKLNVNSFELFPPVLPPLSVCIPQISNRFVYGPWMTNYSILYAGKSVFEQHDDLRPENYIIPTYGSLNLSGGTFSSGINSRLSGFAGLNLAGQALANAIDDFSLFAQEEGTVTIPGLPLISKIGDNLFDGPRITDISVNINSQGDINTTYNFRQNSPRLGKTNRDIVRRLSKLSQTIKAGL